MDSIGRSGGQMIMSAREPSVNTDVNVIVDIKVIQEQ